jgi:hypothetical protein
MGCWLCFLVLLFYTPYERVFAIFVTVLTRYWGSRTHSLEIEPFVGSEAVTWFLYLVNGRCNARMSGQNNFPMVTSSASHRGCESVT